MNTTYLLTRLAGLDNLIDEKEYGVLYQFAVKGRYPLGANLVFALGRGEHQVRHYM